MSEPTDTTPPPPPTPEASRWGVSLYMRVGPDGPTATPADAVAAFLDRILRYGLKGMTYSVEDRNNGELYFVQGDRTFTEEEFTASNRANVG